MDISKIFYPENNKLDIPDNLLSQYPNIESDKKIHGGIPHIKGTRILVTDIFRLQIKNVTLTNITHEFKVMGINVTKKQLDEANKFSVAWLYYLLNGKK